MHTVRARGTRIAPTILAIAALGAAALAAAQPASAAPLDTFSISSNGAVGQVTFQFDPSSLTSGLNVLKVTSPLLTSFSSGTPIDPTSLVGIQVTPTNTLVGIDLVTPGASQTVLFNPNYPGDFFDFATNSTVTGVFTAPGIVTSDFSLATGTPTATLQVGAASPAVVPEPSGLLPMALGLAGLGALAFVARKRKMA